MAPGSKGRAKGNPLALWRETRGLSQQAVAAAIGYSQGMISKLEGNGHQPTRHFAKLLLHEYPGEDTRRLCARWKLA